MLTYDDALARLAAAARAEEDPAINPVCRGFALTHGGRTARCVLLIHGYTNCPQQFRAFAGLLHGRGHSAYVPRLPRHGLADRLTTALAGLTGAELLAWLEGALAVAHGLGERVDVMGISAGANLALYAAQHRPDVHQAVALAPVLGTPAIAPWAVPALARVAAVAPNMFRWWDPQLREQRNGLPHAYPRWATRSLGQIVALGLDVMRAAGRRAPAARDILVVTNPADEAVTSAPAERLVARWRSHGAPVRAHSFPAELGLIHDVIDPGQARQRVELVYPALLELMGA
ncbi:MAG TPA: alpha/beta hydrolase-fold protein [Chloroflexaceae bacterium]|nr:alpha/beta hydrolase-fold protein [Chloroflexaceae bacterium]